MGKQQIWASPQQFLLISSRSRGKLPGWSLLKKGLLSRSQDTRGPVPARHTEGSGQFPEWLTFYVSDL